MKYWIFIILPFMIVVNSVFAITPEYFTLDNPSTYDLEIEKQIYQISYQVDASVLAMDIDPESKSLLVGLENTHDSKFMIQLDHELINAKNNDFIVLVNGFETDYVLSSGSDTSILVFFVPVDSEEIEIIGTSVIPEFPLGVIVSLAAMILVVTIVARTKSLIFKL